MLPPDAAVAATAAVAAAAVAAAAVAVAVDIGGGLRWPIIATEGERNGLRNKWDKRMQNPQQVIEYAAQYIRPQASPRPQGLFFLLLLLLLLLVVLLLLAL